MRGAAPLPHLGLRATRGVPLPVTGRIRRIKTVLALLLVGVFALTPWLRWDRGPGLPGQAVIFDIGGRRLFVFDLELWPQELPLVVLAPLPEPSSFASLSFRVFPTAVVAGSRPAPPSPRVPPRWAGWLSVARASFCLWGRPRVAA